MRKRITCLYCGKSLDIDDAETHPYYCEKYKVDPGKFDTTIPSIPEYKENCTCENCIGIKSCPICEKETMYLYRPKRIWICAECGHFSYVRNIKHVISENQKGNVSNSEQIQRKDVQRRLEFYLKNLKGKYL